MVHLVDDPVVVYRGLQFAFGRRELGNFQIAQVSSGLSGRQGVHLACYQSPRRLNCHPSGSGGRGRDRPPALFWVLSNDFIQPILQAFLNAFNDGFCQ